MANNPFDPPIVQVKKTMDRGGITSYNKGFGSTRMPGTSSRPAPDSDPPQWYPENLGDLGDVDLDTEPPSDGQALVWDGSTWKPGEVAGGGGGGGGGGPAWSVNLARLVSVSWSVNNTTFNNNPAALSSLFNGNKAAGDYVGLGSGVSDIYLDLGAEGSLDLLRLYMYPDSRVYRQVALSVSKDLITWNTVFGPQDVSFGTILYIEAPVPAGEWRYVRIHSEGSTLNNQNEYVEFEIFGTISGGGGGGGGPRDRRWVPGPGEITIDEFNDDSIDAAWEVATHASIPALPSLARPRYVEGGDVLSVKYGPETGVGLGTADGAEGRHHALVRPLSSVGGTLAVGDGIVTAITPLTRANASWRITGLVLSTTNSSGTGNQLYHRFWNGWTGMRALVSWGGNTGVAPDYNHGYQSSPIYLRIVRLSSTTWRGDVSPDGVSWILGQSASTWAFEPTHVGFADANWNSSTPSVMAYEFIRRVSGVA